MRLQDIMTTDVITVSVAETVKKARSLMGLHGVHHLVVVDGRIVAGIVTEDMLRWGQAQDMGCVQDVMHRQPVTAPPTMTVREAANLLRGRVSSVLPVVDDRQHLVGIVTISDFLELLGRGAVRPVPKSKRWTLRHRGVRPKAAAGRR
jgi:acetoin utilization protein AcuB